MASTQLRQGQLSSPVKATAAELDTGTDDAKYATALAIEGSTIVKTTKAQTLTNKTLTTPIINTSGVDARMSAAQTFTNNSWITVAFNAEIYDNLNEYNTTTYTFTAAAAGYYIVEFFIEVTGFPDQSSIRYALYKNGGEVSDSYGWKDTSGTAQIRVMYSTVLKLAANDALLVKLYQNSGVDRSIALAKANYFRIHRIA